MPGYLASFYYVRAKNYIMEKREHLFTNKQLATILIPVIVEQILNVFMGTIDTMMVSNVGSAAISAVSLVDSLNVLIIQMLAALATGGAIVCSQYVGAKNDEKATNAAKQLIFVSLFISIFITICFFIFGSPLLKIIFGQIEPDVMKASKTYFYITIMSFPFVALYNAGAAIFRSQDNTKTPMQVSFTSNVINVVGNALLIFVFNLGVAGAATATLISRMVCAIWVIILLRKKTNRLSIRNYGTIRPQKFTIGKILSLGIPSGIENSMFQLGKLAIQSSVSTLGTIAIAAHAMTSVLEQLNGMAAIGAGMALMTIVGQCIGAGREDEAIYYIKKICVIAEVIVTVSCIFTFAITKPIILLSGMEKASGDLCFYMVCWITVLKPILWNMSFIPGYGMRAAGDVKFSMIASSITMWIVRVGLTVVLIRILHFGPIAVWIGMMSDWGVRSVIFAVRFKSRKWLKHKVI